MAICGHKKQCFLFHPLIIYGQLIAQNLNGFCKSLRPCAVRKALFRPKTDVPKQVVQLSLSHITATHSTS